MIELTTFSFCERVYTHDWSFLPHVAGNTGYRFQGMVAAYHFTYIIAIDCFGHSHHIPGNIFFPACRLMRSPFLACFRLPHVLPHGKNRT